MNAKKPLVAVALSGLLALPVAADAAFVDIVDLHGLQDADPRGLPSESSHDRPDLVRPGKSADSRSRSIEKSSRANKSGKSASSRVKKQLLASNAKKARRGRRGTDPGVGDDLPGGEGPPISDSPPMSGNPPGSPGQDTGTGPGSGNSGGPPPVADAGPGGNGQPNTPPTGDPGEAPDGPGLGDNDGPGSIEDELPNTGIGDVGPGPDVPDGDELTDLLVDIPGDQLGAPPPSNSPPGEGQSAAGPAGGTFGEVPNRQPTAAVPEPSSLALFALGLAGLRAVRRRPRLS